MFHVFSHSPCNDGELASVIWQYFVPHSKYYNWVHNDYSYNVNIISNLPKNSNVVFLDLSPPLYILPTHHNYIIIDHHKDAILTMKNNPKFTNYKVKLYIEDGFPENNKLSGCMLTWKYHTDEVFPVVVHHVGMKDVWDFSDPNTEPYNIGYCVTLKQCKTQMDRRHTITALLGQNKESEFVNIGALKIDEYKRRARKVFTSCVFDVDILDDVKYTIVEVVCSEAELFKYLCDYATFSMREDVLRIHHSTLGDMKNYSLRSIKPTICVDGLARKYGGNGHPRAAGYSINSVRYQ